jgi:hypothetical protein
MRQQTKYLYRVILLLLTLGWCLFPTRSSADETIALKEERAPDRFGMSVELASVYDPGHDISFALVTAFGLFDYGTVWHQDRPKELCFKVEGALGSTFRPETRAIASLGMAAVYFVDRMASPQIRPYVEGGIGIIYTDFRVEGQGLRINFNPQLGIGAELLNKGASSSFAALKLHHVSNGNLYHDNRGINSLVLQVGRFF